MREFKDYDDPDFHEQKTTPDLLETVLSFIGINLMWVFFAIWVLYGMVPVLLLALFINHLITRLEIKLGQRPA
ncbi:histidinol phosphate aminotransferase [Phaeobacter sp. QD34_3]|uniref:histidinol phosphate aminotransferase n=1 Tax=unclassified Phaeobacter TaxID=2621772 RepID=UPI00237F1DC2|nr:MULTISPECIES: histidinol phosphate aminotransferase [unclassified Phaeobacter]MDE4131820.1 histidinol phosphate aminotransferase [Phaeobacter sp. QD34_3]MDE4135458.1 histidinol phosphate aminotransferase [Phaeobacter sp. QD34_24]MDE4173447.1 histidinol phosphate aminotransferase [Phaeobacter sp. PT47_59]